MFLCIFTLSPIGITKLYPQSTLRVRCRCFGVLDHAMQQTWARRARVEGGDEER